MKEIIFKAKYDQGIDGFIYSNGQQLGHQFWLTLDGYNNWAIGHSNNDHDWVIEWEDVEIIPLTFNK